jgi:hypothetical protein
MQNIDNFILDWVDDPLGTKAIFISLFQDLQQKEGVAIEFNERRGISYSLRGIHKSQRERPLFVMIDVIDDNPKQRWISVRFYGDMVEDPDEQGDLIPEGLPGADGYCFDLAKQDDALDDSVRRRIQKAYENACKNGK